MHISKLTYGFRWGIALMIAMGLWWLVAAQPVWACGGGVICVDVDATGAATGLSWTDAYTNVTAALDWTNVHTDTTYEIWVAEGVYYPYIGPDPTYDARYETFYIRYDNVRLYGGFAATETLRTQRDWVAHPTILSGDIDTNDTNTDGNFIAETWNDQQGENAYHVLVVTPPIDGSITGNTVVDGFIITAGYADAGSGHRPYSLGSGLYCGDSNCSPTLNNILFSGNWASECGGGMFNQGWGGASNPVLTNITFRGNRADGGGGMCNISTSSGSESSPVLTNIIFSGNWGSSGGAMFNESYEGSESNPILTNVLFSGNQGYSGGAMCNTSSEGKSYPVLTNATFSGNLANSYGGAIYNGSYGNGASNLTLINSISWGNTAPNAPQFYSGVGATITVSYSDVEWPSGIYTGTGNLNVDPQFVAPIAASSAPTTTGDYHLQTSSQAINTGNNPSVTVSTDLDGAPRIFGGKVDMGAYEFSFEPDVFIYLPVIIRTSS
ncbi:MAG: hypothetical protein JXA21_11480 [Anaerolineae bacterium]|nr:hypothetical protein [Anaerolineae bacterium]